MKIYYSGSEQPNTPQPDADYSLGGYISNSLIVPGKVGNLFDSLSLYSKQKGLTEVRGVFLKNDENVAINNLSLYWDYPNNQSTLKMEVAAVSAKNNDQIEKINSGKDNPYYGDFVESTDENNPIILVNALNPGDVIGLWIKRIIDAKSAPSCDELYENYSEIVPPATLNNMYNPDAPVAPSNDIPIIYKVSTLFNFSWD